MILPRFSSRAIRKRAGYLLVASFLGALSFFSSTLSSQGGPLEDLAKPMEGRSMRATSTMREGEVRRIGRGET
jgi:hypothetical protein